MKVICTTIPRSPTGEIRDSSPWVTIGAEYVVVSVTAEPGRRVLLRLVTDDDSLGLYESVNFVTADDTVPETWTVQVSEGGMMDFAPASWLTPGFWEAYYDADPAAVDAVNSELQALL